MVFRKPSTSNHIRRGRSPFRDNFYAALSGAKRVKIPFLRRKVFGPIHWSFACRYAKIKSTKFPDKNEIACADECIQISENGTGTAVRILM